MFFLRRSLLAGLAMAFAGCSWLFPARAERASARGAVAPVLTREHQSGTGAFSVRVPEGWTTADRRGDPFLTEAVGPDGLRMRVFWRAGESGYDSLHGACMLERLAGAMETAPQVTYEYDYLSFQMGSRRGLDSAFLVTYDQAIDGHRQYRQRNITLVGAGESVCLIQYAPADVWKRKDAQAALDAVLKSVTFRTP